MKRLFRGLRKTPPRERYDAIVIGAGVGGLVCANLLARDGLSVLLVEQHYMVGGYCSTFKRAGFSFDAATHFYPLLGNPETITGRLMAQIGARSEWVLMDPVDTFHLPDGSRFEVPVDLDTYLARLKGEFPASAGAIDAFFSAVRREYLAGLLRYFRGRESSSLAPDADLTLRQALDRHFDDHRLKLVLTADCAHWGSPPDRTSFTFDSMLRLSYFLGNYYPVGGSQAFVDDLARCFEASGGHILMSTRAERVRIANGQVAGVELETTRGPLAGRHEIAADVVVSNVDLLQTVERLVGTRHFPTGYADDLRKLRVTYPCFLTHIGLRDVSRQLLEEIQGYYWNSWNPDEVGRDGLRCKVFSPTLYEPRLAPEGSQIVILQKVVDIDYANIDDWQAHKTEIQEYVVDHLRSLVPGLDDKVVTLLSATAKTSHDFTLNHQGAMLGWEMSPDQLGPARPRTECGVGNLHFTGHWTRPGGGITPVMVSAMEVAQAITGRSAATRSP